MFTSVPGAPRFLVSEAVRGACELLGLDPLYVANEGKLIAVVPREDADRLLTAARAHPLGRDAAIIGTVAEGRPGFVTMRSLVGGERVVPLLDTDDLELQQTVLEVMGRRPGWSGKVIGLLRSWLAAPKRSAGQERSLTGALLAFAGETRVQRLVADTLADPKTAPGTRLLLLRVIARCRVDPLPTVQQRERRTDPRLRDALLQMSGDTTAEHPVDGQPGAAPQRATA